MDFQKEIFSISSESDFNKSAIEVFHFQVNRNRVYREFVNALSINPERIKHYCEIPFLPISFFKSHHVISGGGDPEMTFLSSGTTGMTKSRHQITEMSVYRQSILAGFNLFFGKVSDYSILGLVPTPEENPASSLGYMVDFLMTKAHPREKNFYLKNFPALAKKISEQINGHRKVMLIGLTSALLEFSEQYPGNYNGMIIMETGGMKGKRKELVREELHGLLCSNLRVEKIYSEYGMTELLSQAYSKGEGLFFSPPWMKILIRDTNDPLSLLTGNRTGGVNIIDLANFNSCSFIATQDLGRGRAGSGFEVLGRFQDSDIRGCNLLS